MSKDLIEKPVSRSEAWIQGAETDLRQRLGQNGGDEVVKPFGILLRINRRDFGSSLEPRGGEERTN